MPKYAVLSAANIEGVQYNAGAVVECSEALAKPLVSGGWLDTLLGFPVFTNQSVATMAANAKSIAFGDFNKYKVRRVRSGIQIRRLDERYADQNQVGFVGFMRCDGRLLDAGTGPVKYYANSAT